MKHAIMNDDLFDNWSKKGTWALGLLAADGYFSRCRKGEFTLTNKDLELLEAYKRVFETDKKIYLIDKTKVKGSYSENKIGRLILSNQKFEKFMKSINLWGLKSDRNPFELIPNEYKWSFIKGYFDGDGFFTRGSFGLCGRHELLNNLNNWIAESLSRDSNKLTPCSNTELTYMFRYNGTHAERIYRIMEKECEGTYNSKKYKKMQNHFDIENILL